MGNDNRSHDRVELSEREQTVLMLIAEGLTNKAIAQRLVLSPHTVAWHNRQIFAKLEVDNRTHAVAVARARGLLDGYPPDTQPSEPAQERGHLPIQLTSFVGRDQEIEQLTALLLDSRCRLLTLFGPGGIGKTRLALEVAARIQHRFSHGAYFVSLQSLSHPTEIGPAMASTLGLTLEAEQREPVQQIGNYLRAKGLLLIVDNFEHLLDGAHLLPELLAAADGVHLLVTSREALKLREETIYRVAGLSFPMPAQSWSTSDFSAVQLFAERAKQIAPNFSPTAERSAVARICRLVEGMPLAIELAATWVNTLSCAEIAAEIEGDLEILSTRMRNMPRRHRAMQAVFDHSWQLLTGPEQTAFRRVSIFRGGLTRHAGQAVTGAKLATFQALVDKAFIRSGPPHHRFNIHTLLRQYGEGKLSARPKQYEAVRDRHARYYADYVYRHEQAMRDTMDQSAAVRIHPERGNIDRAWRWALAQEMVEELGKYPAVMNYYLQAWGLFDYANEMFGQMAQHLRQQPSRAQRDWALGRVLGHWGWSLHLQGRNQAACRILEESVPLLDSPTWGYERALNMAFLGNVKRALGHPSQARQLLLEALTSFRSLKSPHGIWIAQQMLGAVEHQSGKFQEAREYYQGALRVAERVSNPEFGVMYTLPYLAMTHSALGNHASARSCVNRALQAMSSNQLTYNALACSLALAAAATCFLVQERHAEAFEVLTLLEEHPLATGDVKQEMRPLLEMQTQQLEPKTRDAVRRQVQTLLEATRQSRQPLFLPPTYLNDLAQQLSAA